MKRETTLFRQFLRYVSLNVCGMLGLSGYILADTFFVANGLGANGLTALNLAIPVYSLVHGCGLMLGMGAATKYSILRGQKETERANKLFSGALGLGAAAAVCFMLAGILFAGHVAALFGADHEVFEMTKTYIRVILLFSPAFLTNDILLSFVRNDGSPGLSMCGMLVGSMANIVLDYIFIFPLHMGILGAVLATGIAPLIGIGISSCHWLSGKNQVSFCRGFLSPALAANIVSLGAPSLITEVASGIVMIVFNAIILGLRGNIGVAAYGVVANLSLVVTSVYTGVAQGTQPMISSFFGRGDKGSVRRLMAYAMAAVALISAGLYAVFFTAAEPIVAVFNSEGSRALSEIAVEGMRLYFAAILFVGINIILSMYFTSTERAWPAQVISLSRGFFVVVPMVFLLSWLFGMTGAWLSYPAAEGLVALLGAALYFRFSHIRIAFADKK